MIGSTQGANDQVVELDVTTNLGRYVLASKRVYRADFQSAMQWQWFGVGFNDPCFAQIEARVRWNGTAYIKQSGIYICKSW